MKKRLSAAFDTMCLHFGYIAFVWFIVWVISPNVLDTWERPELLWFGSLLIVVGLFKGYRDQVKQEKREAEIERQTQN